MPATRTTRSPSPLRRPGATGGTKEVITGADILGTYTRLWGAVWFLFLGVNMIFGSTEAPVPMDLASMAFLGCVCVAGVTAWAPAAVLAHVLSLIHLIKQLPGVFDGDCWSAHHDLSFVLAALYVKWPTITTLSWTQQERDAVVHTAAPLMRAQLVLFYSAAFFWKLGSGFFDPASSCPTIFLMQQLSQWWWPMFGEPPDALVQLAAWSAPYLTEVVEASIAFGFLRPGWCTAAGVVLGLQLHMMIAVTPPPHNIGGYGLRCAVRYMFLMPEAVAKCERRIMDAVKLQAPLSSVVAHATAAASIAAIGSVAKWQIPGGPIIDDYMIPSFYAMCLYLGAAVYGFVSEDQSKRPVAAHLSVQPHKLLWWFVVLEGVWFCYCMPLLGLAENFAPKPFANLRVHGGVGSNHFIAPTNLGAAFGIPIPSSEVVRVEFTTSQRLNELWPAEMTFYLDDGHTKQLLQQVGHSGRIFGPAAARLIGPAFVRVDLAISIESY